MRWKFEWTPERCDILRALRAAGHSAQDIAEKLRDGLTRNAVLGKCWRLRLPWNTVQAEQRPKRPYPKRKKKLPDSKVFPVVIPKSATRPTPMPIPEHPESPPADQVVDIMGLTNETCRWPLDSPEGYQFCGHASADLASGRPYCEYHTSIAHGRFPRTRVAAE